MEPCGTPRVIIEFQMDANFHLVKKKQKHSSSNLRESVASGNNDTQVFDINHETQPSSRFYFSTGPNL